MSTLKFKTNIQCTGCIEKITPYLHKIPAISNWKVDLKDPQRPLSVTTSAGDTASTEQAVITQIKAAGYQIEKLV